MAKRSGLPKSCLKKQIVLPDHCTVVVIRTSYDSSFPPNRVLIVPPKTCMANCSQTALLASWLLLTAYRKYQQYNHLFSHNRSREPQNICMTYYIQTVSAGWLLLSYEQLCVVAVEVKKRSSEQRSGSKEPMYTADRRLLLACVYFDQSHAGYLLDRHVEDIIHNTGLQLSRAQVHFTLTTLSMPV